MLERIWIFKMAACCHIPEVYITMIKIIITMMKMLMVMANVIIMIMMMMLVIVMMMMTAMMMMVMMKLSWYIKLNAILGNSIANALELPWSCAKPSIYHVESYIFRVTLKWSNLRAPSPASLWHALCRPYATGHSTGHHGLATKGAETLMISSNFCYFIMLLLSETCISHVHI